MSEMLMSKKEVAARLGISIRTLNELMRSRRLSFVRLGNCVRFDWSQVQADLSRQTVKARRVA